MDCFRIFQILHISFNTPQTYIMIIFSFGFFDFILYVPLEVSTAYFHLLIYLAFPAS